MGQSRLPVDVSVPPAEASNTPNSGLSDRESPRTKIRRQRHIGTPNDEDVAMAKIPDWMDIRPQTSRLDGPTWTLVAHVKGPRGRSFPVYSQFVEALRRSTRRSEAESAIASILRKGGVPPTQVSVRYYYRSAWLYLHPGRRR